MAMKTIMLTARSDQDFGGVGLVPKGAGEGYWPNHAGTALAHDLIEHVNGLGKIGGSNGIDDELEALGAVWFVRGQFADLSRDGAGRAYSPEENIAGDVRRMFREFFHGGYVNVDTPPRTCACDADAALCQIVEYARDGMTEDVSEDATPEELRTKAEEYLAVCLPRMRVGYRKAQRKYGSATVANRLYWVIAEAAQPHCKHADEGCQYTLIYGTDRNGNAVARCEEVYV